VRTRARGREAELRAILNAPPAQPALPDGALGEFRVLRKWASYTPLDLMRPDDGASADDASGGGYFLWWQGWGLVIDPGVGFGRAFRGAKLVPRNINAVVATHHHIDHTGDMLPVLTCLFEMNQPDDSSGQTNPHEVDFMLSPGAFSAFADVVAYVPGVRSVQLLRAGEETSHKLSDLYTASLRAVPAVHRDLSGRDDAAIGLRIDIRGPKHSLQCRIGISGDTRFAPDEGDAKTWQAIAEAYADVDLMVVHLGSVYPSDAGEADPHKRWQFGYNGVVSLLEEITKASKPGWNPLVLVSEWGEEIGHERTNICEAIAGNDTATPRRVYPAELGQAIGLSKRAARPICTHRDGNTATHWHDEDEETLAYLCDGHDHGAPAGS
jgi:hypothetical protein